MVLSARCVDDFGMSERGLHRIEDDLSDTWLEDWAGAGVAEIEAYLAKHAAFLSFLDTEEKSSGIRSDWTGKHRSRPLLGGDK